MMMKLEARIRSNRSLHPLRTTVLGLAGLLKRPGKTDESLKAMYKTVLDVAAPLHTKTTHRP